MTLFDAQKPGRTAASDPAANAALSSWALGELEQLRDLEDNWDSYDGSPPSPASLASARALILRVEETYGSRAGERVCPFDVAPIPRGGVQIEWRNPDLHLEVEVGPGGEYSYLLKMLGPHGRDYEAAHNASWEQLQAQLERVLLAS